MFKPCQSSNRSWLAGKEDILVCDSAHCVHAAVTYEGFCDSIFEGIETAITYSSAVSFDYPMMKRLLPIVIHLPSRVFVRWNHFQRQSCVPEEHEATAPAEYRVAIDIHALVESN